MPLAAGMRLGPYEVLGLIGAGGMGEVYKAKDTRLDRTVAIKILPADISGNPDRRARFEREAKTIATLSHPNICTLYDVGEHSSSLFLVMEHLAGETLAHRLEKGTLPIDQALDTGAQIAEALSAAHRAGVIHRDLKPANVMLTKSGVKLLDFGLAKLRREVVSAGASATALATQSRPLTSEGTILGTLQYMAPEQLESKEADARTDIWALGLVLYEMLTGKRAFEGQSSASLIAAILQREPAPVTEIEPLTPRAVEHLVRQCLAKSPENRPDTARDLANELRRIAEPSNTSAVLSRRASHRSRLLGAIAVLLLVGFAIGAITSWLLASRRRSAPAPLQVVRSELNVRPAEELRASDADIPTPVGSRTALAWTPDGQALVFVGRTAGVQRIYVRRLDAEEARALPGTEGAQVPAVSPDGQWVAFWGWGPKQSSALKKTPVAGGPVMELLSPVDSVPNGLLVDAQGRVFFGKIDDGISRIDPGGARKQLTSLADNERSQIPSAVLPGGERILYTSRKRAWTWGDEEIVALNVTTGERKVLLRDAADARFVPTGHLVFLRRGTMFAVPFDAARVEVTGPPVPVLDGVAQSLTAINTDFLTGAGQFAFSSTGSLAWIPGRPVSMLPAMLAKVDRRGRVSTLRLPQQPYGGFLRVSPTGRQIAIGITTLSDIGLWIYDLDRGTLIPLHRNGETLSPAVWSRDAQRLYFLHLEEGRYSLRVQAADGSAPPAMVHAGSFFPTSWTADGRLVGVINERQLGTASVDTRRGGIQPLRTTSELEEFPEVSPDGHWLVFGSTVSGRWEIYVQPYPGPGPKTLISTAGGGSPAWNPSGRELFYVGDINQSGKASMMAVDFAPGTPPRLGTPRLLFEFEAHRLLFDCLPTRCYDVAPDGQSFYAVQAVSSPSMPVTTHINLVQNWFEELKAKVP